ncbi:MAG: gliding motility-associated C-terminal domain-containing protein, partial [Flavobacteriales bacterium]|nr:gliding motility-associated C-terminal domain-containing protein [Flavobacteriales bacterium]
FDTICKGEQYNIGNNSYDTSGIYLDTIPSALGCDSIVELHLHVLPSPEAKLTYEDSYLEVNKSGYDYQWYFGEEKLEGETFRYYRPTETGLYAVDIDDPEGCMLQLDYWVDLNCGELEIPNVFTPNNDDLNETFPGVYCAYDKFRLVIVNRWGQEIFISESADLTWDGRNPTGEEVPEGSYLYFISILDIDGNASEYRGTVTLIR